ncbi:hypothetical protein LAZ67_X001034 [Cordylochernes scorpioides]|uniref:Transposase Tc1-like domain-containing protein n=1 Tax=Cordylochernes scorpioides TaxID=51811 RepID=A0ABY6LU82_9ARAC|nr:hypothetical protein LAZ67_X001034 [Cordylochernes scorpioides]
MPGHRKRRAGWSIRQIAADTHLGASTVHRLWRRWLEQGNVAIYRNVGATRVTSARVDRRILRQAVAAPQATCTAILQHVQATLDHSISTRTISRRLVANGLHSCRPLRRLPLTPPNRRQRLEWCRARSTWMTEWHRVVFSDESRFCLSSDSRRVRVWRRRGERSNPAAIVERPTVRQGGIMVWGAIAYDSRSPLLRIQGTMTAQRYVDDVLRPDNARPRTARISQQALQDVQMLPWPPYSPDLSPIEHVWDIIERRLHALPQSRSEDELWQMVEREWRAIPQDAIRTLIDSLPRRVAACIAVRGLDGHGGRKKIVCLPTGFISSPLGKKVSTVTNNVSSHRAPERSPVDGDGELQMFLPHPEDLSDGQDSQEWRSSIRCPSERQAADGDLYLGAKQWSSFSRIMSVFVLRMNSAVTFRVLGEEALVDGMDPESQFPRQVTFLSFIRPSRPAQARRKACGTLHKSPLTSSTSGDWPGLPCRTPCWLKEGSLFRVETLHRSSKSAINFGCKVGDQDKTWAPHHCCEICARRLTGWIKGERNMPFAVPMIWREPKDHSSDCYFCLTKTTSVTSKSRHTVEYPDLLSAMRPVPHSDILPVPQPPENVIFSDDDSDRREQQSDDKFEAAASSEPHFLTQGDLNDLMIDAVSHENGEMFHQDISSMEKRYQGKWSPGMLADYCWALKKDVPQTKYRSKSTVTTFQ